MIGAIRQCTKCSQSFPASAEFFAPNKQCKYGLEPICRVCRRAYAKLWKQENRERILITRRDQYAERYGEVQRAKERVRKTVHPLRVRAQVLRAGMRGRSREKGIPFDSAFFTVARLICLLEQQKTCECCGQVLDIGFKLNNQKNDASPSIDRIVPSKGYTQGNIALLCWRCNNLKRDATWEELYQIAMWLKEQEVAEPS